MTKEMEQLVPGIKEDKERTMKSHGCDYVDTTEWMQLSEYDSEDLTPWMQPRGCESVNELEWMSYSKDQKEETKDKDLNVPLDPMTRSKQARFHEALHQLLHTIHSSLECAYPTSLVVIQAAQIFIKRGVVTCTLFLGLVLYH